MDKRSRMLRVKSTRKKTDLPVGVKVRSSGGKQADSGELFVIEEIADAVPIDDAAIHPSLRAPVREIVQRIKSERMELQDLMGPVPTAEKVRSLAHTLLENRLRALNNDHYEACYRLADAAGFRHQDVWPPGVEWRMAHDASECEALTLKAVSVLVTAVLHKNVHALRRIVSAVRPASDERTRRDAVAQAYEIIEREIGRAQCEDVGAHLLHELADFVHPGFGKLLESMYTWWDRGDSKSPAQAELEDLLSRATLGKARNPKRGERSRLTPAGILVALNRMARHPLGRRLSTTYVAGAVKGYRQRPKDH